jgi:peptidyl-prolyl cis-trans isomerase C
MRTLLLSALLTAALVGCNPGTRPVATVDGEAITVSQLADKLPPNLDTTAKAESIKLTTLNRMIDQKVVVREARRRDLEKDIQYELEKNQKFLVTQRLFEAVTEQVGAVSDADLRSAYELLKTEAHLQVMVIKNESLARQAAAELDAGVPFETLAARYSSNPTAAKGGDVGFVPELYIEEPVRSEVLKLNPGEHTAPTSAGGQWQIVRLLESRPASPPPPSLDDKEFHEQLARRLQQQQRRALANKYLVDLRARVKYNEPGMQLLMTKPVDSMTDADKEVQVAVRDGKQYVKVLRLLKVARDFPVQLDTGLKRYAIQREIEEDLMYEDGLKRGLEKLPKVAKQLAERHEDLLYQALYNQEVAAKVNITDEEIRAYYDANRQQFVEPDFEKVKASIRDRLTRERTVGMQQEYIAGLRAKAKITIDEKLLKSVRPTPKPKENKPR